MSDLNILIVGEAGSGKSTAARIVTWALQKEGFKVELMDKDDINSEQFVLRLKELQGATVRVTCGNVKLNEVN